jgi:hypothetical protein
MLLFSCFQVPVFVFSFTKNIKTIMAPLSVLIVFPLFSSLLLSGHFSLHIFFFLYMLLGFRSFTWMVPTCRKIDNGLHL